MFSHSDHSCFSRASDGLTLALTLAGYDTVPTSGYSLDSLIQLIQTKEKKNDYHPSSKSRSNGKGDCQRCAGILPKGDNRKNPYNNAQHRAGGTGNCSPFVRAS